ncbi:MAG: hypothetical protein WA110_03695 [Anaerolineaceae bacterium]
MDQQYFDQLINDVQRSKKYRDLDLPTEMLRELLSTEIAKTASKAEITQAFRKKLHNIVAPYLENIDYPEETRILSGLAQSAPEENALKAWARSVMTKHASTCERLPYLENFFGTIFQYTGAVTNILDLACGLDPLMLPWMNLSATQSFSAFDIHKPRVDFLNQFFSLFYPNARAIHQDILVQTPSEPADCAFFFKEAHRFEKRQPGCNQGFFDRLNVKTIVVSLPANDLAGHHSLVTYHTNLILKSVEGFAWQLERAQVGDELLFFIHKS